MLRRLAFHLEINSFFFFADSYMQGAWCVVWVAVTLKNLGDRNITLA